MKVTFPRWFALVLLATWLAPPAAAARAGDYCTDNWSKMASAVEANGLTPAKDLQELAQTKVDGKLIKVSLCEAAGAFSYNLVILQPGGQLVTLALDARNPFPQ